MDIEFFKKIPHFSKLTEEKLSEIVRHTEVKEFNPDEIILHEGDLADAFYIIVQGEVRVFTRDAKGNKVILARLQKGEGFGEQAFSSSTSPRRTASVEALTICVLYRISREVLLNLEKKNAHLKELLQTQFQDYTKTKISKLADAFSESLNFSKLLRSTKSLEQSEVLYRQGDNAKQVFILLQGAIELRKFDEHKQVTHHLELSLGETFGNEASQKNGVYQYTAVAKVASQVVVIPVETLKEHIEEMPQFIEYGQKLEKQHQLSHFGQTFQFRGQYLDLPVFVTLILLKDKREIICQVAVSGNMTIINTAGVKHTKTYEYKEGDYQIELHIKDGHLVGLKAIGIGNDTDKFLALIVKKQKIEEEDLLTFQSHGHLDFSCSKVSLDKNLLCNCMRIPKEEIENLIKEGCNFEDIRNKTRASTVCGACGPAIKELLGTSAWISCKLLESTLHNDYIRTFRFEPLSKTNVAFIPGQHIIIRADIDNLPIQRSYTLTSSPKDPYFEVTIKREEKGQFSPWIFDNAKKNPLLHVSGPYGDFALKMDSSPIICFAGGIGITPFVAFSRYLCQKKPDSKLHIDYSARTQKDFAFRDELEKSLKEMPNAHLHFRETSLHGKITEDEIKTLLHKFPKPQIYICGPSAFEESLMKMLKNAQVPSDHIHTERFVQAGAPSGSPQMITF